MHSHSGASGAAGMTPPGPSNLGPPQAEVQQYAASRDGSRPTQAANLATEQPPPSTPRKEGLDNRQCISGKIHLLKDGLTAGELSPSWHTSIACPCSLVSVISDAFVSSNCIVCTFSHSVVLLKLSAEACLHPVLAVFLP